jgi:hypothetical protein
LLSLSLCLMHPSTSPHTSPSTSAYHDTYLKWRQRREEEQGGAGAEEEDEEDVSELKLWGCPLRRQMVRGL